MSLPDPQRASLPDATGGSWRVWRWGPPPSVDGPSPVVALHGFTGSGLDFEGLHPLGDNQRTFFAPDLPGHGGSVGLANEAYTYKGIVATLGKFIATLPRPPILLGYSLGGRLALHTAAHHPATLRGLVLLSAGPGLTDPDARRARVESDARLADRLLAEPFETFLEGWEAQPILRSQSRIPAPWGERLRARRRRQDPAELARSLRATGQGVAPPLPSAWRDASLPVFHLSGENDPVYQEQGAALVAHHPRRSAHIFPASGHTLHLEQLSTFRPFICQIWESFDSSLPFTT